MMQDHMNTTSSTAIISKWKLLIQLAFIYSYISIYIKYALPSLQIFICGRNLDLDLEQTVTNYYSSSPVNKFYNFCKLDFAVQLYVQAGLSAARNPIQIGKSSCVLFLSQQLKGNFVVRCSHVGPIACSSKYSASGLWS